MTRAKDFHHDAWWDHDRPSGILHLARDLAGEARVRSRSLNERGAKVTRLLEQLRLAGADKAACNELSDLFTEHELDAGDLSAYVAGEVLLRAHPERLWADIIGSFDGWPEDCREPLPRT